MLTGITAPQTLEEAIAILNEKRHRGSSDWFIEDKNQRGKRAVVSESLSKVIGDIDDLIDLTEFEAVAVAQRYFMQEMYRGARAPL